MRTKESDLKPTLVGRGHILIWAMYDYKPALSG